MLPAPFTNALVLTGPTGSGKTALGVELAERLGAEIVSMDSMALYRCMDIGTAKPSAQERNRVPHHLIDVLDPSLTGRPISEWQQEWSVVRRPLSVAESSSDAATDHGPRATGNILWLDLPRAELYDRINQRVDGMFAQGLVEEVQALRKLDRPISK